MSYESKCSTSSLTYCNPQAHSQFSSPCPPDIFKTQFLNDIFSVNIIYVNTANCYCKWSTMDHISFLLWHAWGFSFFCLVFLEHVSNFFHLLQSFFLRLFFRAVLWSQWNWEKGTAISHIPSALTHVYFPHNKCPPPKCYIFHSSWIALTHHYYPGPQFTLESLLVLYILWVWTNILWHVFMIIVSFGVFSPP